jgi:hypothetical protein
MRRRLRAGSCCIFPPPWQLTGRTPVNCLSLWPVLTAINFLYSIVCYPHTFSRSQTGSWHAGADVRQDSRRF